MDNNKPTIPIRIKPKGSSEWKSEYIEGKPLNLICHKNDVDIDSPGAFTLDPDVTRYHGERVMNIDPSALEWIERILGYPLPDFELRGIVEHHVIGLVDLCFKMPKTGVTTIMVKFPETYLHPAQQAELGSLFTYLAEITE